MGFILLFLRCETLEPFEVSFGKEHLLRMLVQKFGPNSNLTSARHDLCEEVRGDVFWPHYLTISKHALNLEEPLHADWHKLKALQGSLNLSEWLLNVFDVHKLHAVTLLATLQWVLCLNFLQAQLDGVVQIYLVDVNSHFCVANPFQNFL